MTEPSHALIVAGLKAAWSAMADGRFGDSEAIIHDLHSAYGTVEVLAVASALLAGPAPAGGGGRG